MDGSVQSPVARSPGILAGVVAATGIGVILLSLLVWGSRGFRPLPVSFGSGLLSMGVGAFVASTDIVIGWRLVARQPRSPIGWLLIAAGLTFVMVIPIGLLVAQAEEAFRPAPDLTVGLAWAQSSFGIPILATTSLLIAMLFPDGRFLGPRWRLVAVVTVVGASLIALSVALDPTGPVWYPTMPNPFAAPAGALPVLAAARGAGVAIALLASGLMCVAVMRRYRTGDRVVRAQLRWILFAVAVEALLFSAFVLVRYLVRVPDELGEVLVALAEAGSAAVPLAAAVAITRYHLFGIDVLISRTILVVLLMAILGGLSTAIVAVTQRLFVAWTGQPSDASLVVAVFLAATVYTPIRKALESGLDRWTRTGTARVEGRLEPVEDRVAAFGARAPTPAPPDAADPELLETAAAILALRGFERRWADAASEAPGPAGGARTHRVAIDAAGRVACPSAGEIPVTACLACPRLRSVVASSRRVVCAADDVDPPLAARR